MLRISHCLDSRLRDGGKFVRHKHRPRSTPQKHFPSSSSHFCYRLNRPEDLVRLEGLGKLKKKRIIYLIRSRTCDLSACSIVPQPLRHHVLQAIDHAHT
jgi:hypothetical protein